MKTQKMFLLLAIVAAMGSGMLTACGHSDGGSGSTSTNGLSSGSVTSDGSTTGSSTTIGGVAANISIQNIARSGYYAQSVNYYMSINGMGASMQATTVSTPGYLGSFQYETAIGCYDASTCNTILLGVLLWTNNDYEEIAIKKDMVNNRVVSVKEYKGPASAMKSIVQLMADQP